jgi:phosphoribosylformimino-5-aminoimidazole carboxamide ribotide isomerase
MIVIPAIDIRGGVCAQAANAHPRGPGIDTDDPLELAALWERHGFRRLQVMDFDERGASFRSRDLVRDLLGECTALVQVGGDIVSGDQVQQLTGDGAAFVIVGQRALQEPEWLDGTAAAFPGQLIVAMRVNGRQLESRGRTQARDAIAVIDDFATLPLAALLLASEYGPGGLTSDDLFLLEDAADASAHSLLVAGGLRRLRDLRALQERGVAGAIVGAPLYDGTFDPRLIAEEFAE